MQALDIYIRLGLDSIIVNIPIGTDGNICDLSSPDLYFPGKLIGLALGIGLIGFIGGYWVSFNWEE